MSDDIIARAEAALEGVTDGPWVVGSDTDCMSGVTTYHLIEIERFRGYRNNVYCGEDRLIAQFIATARTLVPDLVDALKAARAEQVQLPSQTIIPTGWGDDCLGAWPVDNSYIDPVSAWPKGQVAMPDGDFMPAAKARALAAALLAAANAAEAAINA